MPLRRFLSVPGAGQLKLKAQSRGGDSGYQRFLSVSLAKAATGRRVLLRLFGAPPNPRIMFQSRRHQPEPAFTFNAVPGTGVIKIKAGFLCTVFFRCFQARNLWKSGKCDAVHVCSAEAGK